MDSFVKVTVCVYVLVAIINSDRHTIVVKPIVCSTTLPTLQIVFKVSVFSHDAEGILIWELFTTTTLTTYIFNLHFNRRPYDHIVQIQ